MKTTVRKLLLIMLCLPVLSFAQTSGIVYFPFNSANLTAEAKAELNKLSAKQLQSIGIFGHTDQVGSDAYNEWLSLERAKVVRDYLLSKGVNESNISMVLGYGAKRLISPGEDEMSRSLNRRAVIMNNYKPTVIDLDIARAQQSINGKPEQKEESTTVQPSNTTGKINTTTNEPTTARAKPAPVVKEQKREKLVEDIQDRSTRVGEHIALRNINFHPGQNIFLESALPALQDLLEAMQKIPTLQVEILGHVCCTEDESDALDIATGRHDLSVSRARAVYDYLIEKGISNNRVSFKGMARQYPLVAVETTEADRVVNRRVEIRIVKK